MSIADYAHWNEDAEYMWWHEEGKHEGHHEDFDPYDGFDDYYADIPHSSRDECIDDGCFSTKDGVHWCCDICEDDAFVFVEDGDGGFRSVLVALP